MSCNFAFCNELLNSIPENYSQAIIGGAVGAFLTALGILAVIFGIALYAYHAWAWMVIAKKMKYKNPWLAWIPLAGSAMRLQLGKFHWAWIFLILIPIAGWFALIILLTISLWRIFEKRKYPGWLALSFSLIFIPRIEIGMIIYLIIIGIIAWKKK